MTKWNQKTVGQLRKIASKMGLKGYLSLDKIDLIELIEKETESQKQEKESHKLKNKPIKKLQKMACGLGLKDGSNFTKHDLIVFIDERCKKNFVFNDECPICLSNDEVFHVMKPCKHQIHLDCANGLLSLNCPICRSEVKNFPSDIRQKFNENTVEPQEPILNLREEMPVGYRPRYFGQFFYDALYFFENRQFLRNQQQVLRNQQWFFRTRALF